MKGMKYISTPRPGVRRGGGAAIVVNTEQFSISKLNVLIPSCAGLYPSRVYTCTHSCGPAISPDTLEYIITPD